MIHLSLLRIMALIFLGTSCLGSAYNVGRTKDGEKIYYSRSSVTITLIADAIMFFAVLLL